MIHDLFFNLAGVFPSKKVIWLSDLHIDAADKERVSKLFEAIAAHDPDSLLIGGDISNGIFSLKQLGQIDQLIGCPLFFVLGNHDFYHHSIREIRREVHLLCAEHPKMHYLTEGGLFELAPGIALIGHDGWSDARAGDFLHSEVMLNDYFLIDELKSLSQESRMEKLHQLGSEAAEALRPVLRHAIAAYAHIILLTHAPPFEEVCLYQGNQCDPQWSPHFVCQAMGEMLREEMAQAKTELLVLCGHTHHGDDKQILPNVRVIAGHSVLGAPTIQGLIHI